MVHFTKPTVRIVLILSVVTFTLVVGFTNCSNFTSARLGDLNAASTAPGTGTGDTASPLPNQNWPTPAPTPSPSATPPSTPSPTATAEPSPTPSSTPGSNFTVTPSVLNLDLAQVGEIVISGGLPPYNFTGAGIATINDPGPVSMWSLVRPGDQVFTIRDAAGESRTVTLRIRGELGSLYAYFDEIKIGDLYYRLFGYTANLEIAKSHQSLFPGINFPIFVGEQMANTHAIYSCPGTRGEYLSPDPSCGQSGGVAGTKLGYMYSVPNAVPGEELIKQIRLYDPVSGSRVTQASSVEIGAGWVVEGVLGYRPKFVPEDWCEVRVPCQ